MPPETTYIDRRSTLRAISAIGLGSLVAGCLGDDDVTPDDDIPEEVHEFLDGNNANEYDGTLADATGQSEVTVENGAGGQGFAYDPPVLKVDVDTTVVWEWTGRGGSHNVVSRSESEFEFESDGGDLIAEAGHTFEYMFEEPGIAYYECTAHVAQGQVAVVIVE